MLLLAVFLTGATSLAYEVAWSRALVLVLGSTAVTTAVVLAVFVGALGLGARWGGPRADAMARPLVFYGVLEIGAAVWALLALLLATGLLTPYAALAGSLGQAPRFVLRLLVAAIVVAPGAFLLGATLPALVRFWVAKTPGGAGRGTAWVYGVNTMGAVAGALVTGFWGIAGWGVAGWLAVAAAVAATVGVLAVVVGRGRVAGLAPVPASVPAPAPAPAPAPDGEALPLRPALFAAALCGGIGLGLEVMGFRVLVFFVEGFTATFAAMLGVFILGLGLGSLAFGPWLASRQRPDRVLGWLLMGTGAVLMLSRLWLLPRMESVVSAVKAYAYEGAEGEAGVQAALRLTALAGSAVLLLVPALLLGATFPLCVRWAERAGLPAGRAVGRIYVWNSVGTITAPFLVGFVLIPLTGVPDTWRFLSLVCLLGGLGVANHVDGFRRQPARAKLAWTFFGLTLGAFLLLPVLQTDGARSSRRLVEASHLVHGREDRRLEAVATDAITTASVIVTDQGERILYTDDFAAAATGRHYRYMRMLGHLPVLLAKDPANAMVIAFGTGTTAGAVARHEDVKRIEVVEVSRAVFDLAPYFEEANRKVLEDRRVTKVLDDGRNALLLHEPDLDVITLEPLMPYSPAGLPFYTREFYELARDRLTDGGVLCQWVPVHAMPAGLYAAFLQTFFDVFPEGQLWFFEQSSALIAVKGEGATREAFEARARAVADDLSAAGFTTPELVLSGFVSWGGNVRASPVPPSPFTGRIVEDLDPFPEFHPTPRASLNTTYLKDTLSYLATLVASGGEPPYTAKGDPATRRLRHGTASGLGGRAAEAWAAWNEIASRGVPRGSPARIALRSQALLAWQAAERWYAQAQGNLPGEAVLGWRRARAMRRGAAIEVGDLLARARVARTQGQGGEKDLLEAALGAAERALEVEDTDALSSERERAGILVAGILVQLGRCESAARLLEPLVHALPEGSAERERVGRALLAIRDRAVGSVGDAPDWLVPLLDGAPPCRPEGLEALREHARDLAEVLEGGSLRAARLATERFLAQTRAEEVGPAAAGLLKEIGTPANAQKRALLAVLCSRLDAADPDLGLLLVYENPRLVMAALREAGRQKVLRRHVDEARRSVTDERPAVRTAFAEGAGADGGRELLLAVIDLLLDDDRSVRLAAATALVPHAPGGMQGYDPDAASKKREAAAAAIRKAFN